MNSDSKDDLDSAPQITSVEALFATAVAMEAEAARRYAELARRMAAADQSELAELFADLERREREYTRGTADWAARRDIDLQTLPEVVWRKPETLTERQIAEAGGEALMTPESALNLAIYNEERVFAFYTRIATEVSDERVRNYAERMARAQIDHVALLRLERRRAARRRLATETGPATFEAPEPMLAHIDEQMAEGDERLATAAAALRAARPRIAARLARLAGERSPSESADDPEAAATLVNAELKRAERLYEILMRTIEGARDEELVVAAQQQAERVLARLAQLSDLRSALHY